MTTRVATDASPAGVVFNLQASLVLSIFPVLLAATSSAAGAPGGRAELWQRLPLDRGAVNLARLVGLAASLWPVLVTWPLLVSLLQGVYGPFSGWVVASAAVVVAIGLLLPRARTWWTRPGPPRRSWPWPWASGGTS